MELVLVYTNLYAKQQSLVESLFNLVVDRELSHFDHSTEYGCMVIGEGGTPDNFMAEDKARHEALKLREQLRAIPVVSGSHQRSYMWMRPQPTYEYIDAVENMKQLGHSFVQKKTAQTTNHREYRDVEGRASYEWTMFLDEIGFPAEFWGRFDYSNRNTRKLSNQIDQIPF
jgi:hypothetical protein